GQQPKFTLVVNKDVQRAAIALASPAGNTKQAKGPTAAGGTIEFVLPQKKPGVTSWKGSLDVEFADGTEASMPLTFQTEVLSAQFTFGFTKNDLDLKNDRLTFKSQRPTGRYEVEIYGDDDELLASSAQDFATPIPAGEPVPVSWNPKKKADVLRIRIVAFDDNGSFRSSDSFPYTITIPHEDVVFDSGKAVVRADQEAKLQAALPEIEKATKRFGPAMRAAGATIRLFVGGHTDTVGASSTNQALSQARAVAIGKWFTKHGVPVAVYARGFGEGSLKVETPDETDNEQNRRVDYDVGNDSPTGSLSGWTAVK
ncbi:MAG TPA: OmpA family protein, partial [Myxococcota bacterium]